MTLAVIFPGNTFAQNNDAYNQDAQYRAQYANANAAEARSLALQALTVVQHLQQEQEGREAAADQKALDEEKAELDRQIEEAKEDNDAKRSLYYRSLQAAAIRGNLPATENLAALYTQVVESSWERALTMYPVLADPEGMQRLALDAYVQRALSDPARRAEFGNANWPEKFAREFAVKMKIAAAPARMQPAAAAMPEAPRATVEVVHLIDPPLAVKPVPDSFTVLTLTNGRVLHDAAIKGFFESSAMVKHSGGIETIAYSLFPSEYQAGLAVRKPRPPSPEEIESRRQKAEAALAVQNRLNDEAHAQTKETVKVGKMSARSDSLGKESMLAKQTNAAKDMAEHYFMYEYTNGSGPTFVDVKTEKPEEIPGWYGAYRIRGKAYLAYDYGRAVRDFVVETEMQDDVVVGKTIKVY